ncbi:MAG: hypothetical protein OXT67_14080 [Zetaproteobacteria bacterium]|nr:hypothetical protein [Zetaproteobacteria bacterium]
MKMLRLVCVVGSMLASVVGGPVANASEVGLQSGSTVVRGFAGRTVTFSHISLNETGTNFVQVEPGALVFLDVDWSSQYTSSYCPGCIQQFYVGIKDQGISCLYSGNTARTVRGQGYLELTAPSEPGFYVVQAASSLQFSCTKQASQLSDRVQGAIAMIQVLPPAAADDAT